ncbi:MAG: divalent-cation tolerance protein CutA [Legionellales bacterium]|nr:divalent-cation tolerance protein CutA [Legionellales bacterium]|tara:strand:- start:631 stop:954 length:324 start_codon:yes stop_codon:yes gene_type:complete
MFESSQIILTTCPDEILAKQLARALVEKKLAACVKIIPNIQSIYFWDEALVEKNEYQLLIMTRDSCFDEIKDLLKEIHVYDVPEIVSLSIHHGSTEYLNWIKDYVQN